MKMTKLLAKAVLLLLALTWAAPPVVAKVAPSLKVSLEAKGLGATLMLGPDLLKVGLTSLVLNSFFKKNGIFDSAKKANSTIVVQVTFNQSNERLQPAKKRHAIALLSQLTGRERSVTYRSSALEYKANSSFLNPNPAERVFNDIGALISFKAKPLMYSEGAMTFYQQSYSAHILRVSWVKTSGTFRPTALLSSDQCFAKSPIEQLNYRRKNKLPGKMPGAALGEISPSVESANGSMQIMGNLVALLPEKGLGLNMPSVGTSISITYYRLYLLSPKQTPYLS